MTWDQLATAPCTPGNQLDVIGLLFTAAAVLMDICLTGRTQAAAVLLGLATHWRVYPIIYSLPILLWLPSACNHQGTPQKVFPPLRLLAYVASGRFGACTWCPKRQVF